MTQTGWLAIGAVLVAVAAIGTAWVGRRWWLRNARRAMSGLVAHAESVGTSLRSLEDLLRRLSGGDAQVWSSFASDAASDHRREAGEILHRMEVVAHEIRTRPLPKSAHPAADAIETVARTLVEELRVLELAQEPEEVVEAVTAIDLAGASERFDAALASLSDQVGVFGMTETSVYGGGLYI